MSDIANLFIIDDLDPETIAMLQALYSRSPESVMVHLEKVRKTGSRKFMETFYVGYNHGSIGDCGVTYCFIENVSMLNDKAFQDNPMYSGQETSTRYIDFNKQGYVCPVDSDEARAIFEAWLDFYKSEGDALRCHLREIFPLKPGEDAVHWEKAIKARSFDILRGFLPAGMKTQLSWTTNLRQAYEHIRELRYHPLLEVRSTANSLLEKLKEKYQSSFSHKEYEAQERYFNDHAEASGWFYLDKADDVINAYNRGEAWLLNDEDLFNYRCGIDNEQLEKQALGLIRDRPKFTNLPKKIAKFGNYDMSFLIDFGSFRDIQRHRNGVCEMPLLTGKLGFHTWYLDQMPEDMRQRGIALIDSQMRRIAAFQKASGVDDYALQYFYPMGMNVACEMTYSLRQMVYVTELRSSVTVHPTLRRIAHKMHNALAENHPNLALYSDLSEEDFSVKRGKQDIVKKD